MRNKTLFLKGIALLSLVPILLVAFGLFFQSLTIFIVLLYTLVIYILLMFLKVPYSDLDTLDQVIIPGSPEEIAKFLKARTRFSNRLINVEIILALGKRSLIQSKIAERIRKRGIELTPPQINKYLSDMERLRVVQSEKGIYKRTYSLTEKGKWCHKAIKKCFPRRQFWFIIRHYLDIKKLPPYPETTED